MDQQASASDALLTSVTSVNDAAIKQAAKKQKLETPELVNKALQIRSDLRTVCLSKDAKNQIQVQALRILTERNPFWQHMLDVRVVTTYDLQGQPIGNHMHSASKPGG